MQSLNLVISNPFYANPTKGKEKKRKRAAINMEWWQKNEEYQPGISIFKGMRLNPPSSNNTSEEFTQEVGSVYKFRSPSVRGLE